jgi:hypothetical protein
MASRPACCLTYPPGCGPRTCRCGTSAFLWPTRTSQTRSAYRYRQRSRP